MREFWLIRYVSLSYPIMTITKTYLAIAIALGCKIMIAMVFPSYARSSMKRLQVFFTCIITFSYFINIIAAESSWYVILIIYN